MNELQDCEDGYDELDNQLQEIHFVLRADPLESPLDAVNRIMNEYDEMRIALSDALSYFEAQWEQVGKHPASHYVDYIYSICNALGKEINDE